MIGVRWFVLKRGYEIAYLCTAEKVDTMCFRATIYFLLYST